MKKIINVYLNSLYKFREDINKPINSLNPSWKEMYEEINKVFENPKLIFGISKFGNSVINFNNKGYINKLEIILGFNEINEVIKKDVLENWTIKNIELIKNIPNQQVSKLQNIFYKAVGEGTSNKDIEKELKEIFNWSDHRVRLVTRDQIGKLNASLDQIKQEQAGIEEYFWITVGDQSVRVTHQERDGQKFRWDNPPLGGHPGQDIRCRCHAEPVLDKIFDEGYLKELGMDTDFKKADWLIEEEKKYKILEKNMAKKRRSK
jgi:SPP1 gp7 family putative phage head morphogenesis protein